MDGACVCGHCGHSLSFADHVESVLSMGIHTADDVRRMLSGDRFFLTVKTDRPREMQCVKCGMVSKVPRPCYSTKAYGYA